MHKWVQIFPDWEKCNDLWSNFNIHKCIEESWVHTGSEGGGHQKLDLGLEGRDESGKINGFLFLISLSLDYTLYIKHPWRRKRTGVHWYHDWLYLHFKVIIYGLLEIKTWKVSREEIHTTCFEANLGLLVIWWLHTDTLITHCNKHQGKLWDWEAVNNFLYQHQHLLTSLPNNIIFVSHRVLCNFTQSI